MSDIATIAAVNILGPVAKKSPNTVQIFLYLTKTL